MRKRFFLNCLLILTLVVVMSTSAFAISESDVESAVSASGKEAVSGNVLVWFLCAIAFLKGVTEDRQLLVQSRSERWAYRRLHALRGNDRHARHQHRDQRGRQRIGQAAAVTVLLLHPGNPAVEARLRQAFSAADSSAWQAAKSRAMRCVQQRRKRTSSSRSRRRRPSAGHTRAATPIPVRSRLLSSSGRTPASLTRISRRFLPAL